MIRYWVKIVLVIGAARFVADYVVTPWLATHVMFLGGLIAGQMLAKEAPGQEPRDNG